MSWSQVGRHALALLKIAEINGLWQQLFRKNKPLLNSQRILDSKKYFRDTSIFSRNKVGCVEVYNLRTGRPIWNADTAIRDINLVHCGTNKRVVSRPQND